MIFSQTVLQKIAEWPHPGDQRLSLAIADLGAGWSVAVTADRRDSVGSLVWEIAMQTAGQNSAATLADWASAVARRVTGLLEQLHVVEVDQARNEALLRSETPAKRGDNVLYYEVLLSGTRHALIRRFQGSWQPGQRRDQVLFSLTHEALAKLVTDVAGV